MLVDGLIGWQVAADEGGGEKVVHLIGPDALAAVESAVPGDADEPDTHVADLRERRAAFKNADENVLDYVLRFGAVAEDGMSDAEE